MENWGPAVVTLEMRNITENKEQQPAVKATKKNIGKYKSKRIWLIRKFLWSKKRWKTEVNKYFILCFDCLYEQKR